MAVVLNVGSILGVCGAAAGVVLLTGWPSHRVFFAGYGLLFFVGATGRVWWLEEMGELLDVGELLGRRVVRGILLAAGVLFLLLAGGPAPW